MDGHRPISVGWSDKFGSFLPLLTDYFKDKGPEDFVTQQEFLALMGLHVLQDDYDGAIEIMDSALERGFIFIGVFKEPISSSIKPIQEGLIRQRPKYARLAVNWTTVRFYDMFGFIRNEYYCLIR